METEKVISALEETISNLRTSKSSGWSPMPVEDIIRRLEAEIAKSRNATPLDINFLDRLFAPTGILQEVSIDSGWGTKFLRISEIIDEFIGGK